MYLIGLTGGIGSGKSSVAARLAAHGCDVIDADAVAREVVEPGEPALEEIAERFGREVIAPDGSLDRARLAALAFVDDESRAELERITHPRVAARIAEWIAHLAGSVPDGRLVVVDHPLLVETGQHRRFDAVVVVLADAQLRLRRLVEERGLSEDDVRARFRAQASDEQRRAVATHVIENEGTLAQLDAAVDALYDELKVAAVED
ncbi:MAG: dephospho-CoA kinase [Nitriliruptoraceae bacterium]